MQGSRGGAVGSSSSSSSSSNSGTSGRRGNHKHNSSLTGSINIRTAELTSAYASLANELTRKEIKVVGGYTLGKTIGEGSFGTVRIGVHRLTNTRVAIKQVPKSLPFSSDPSSPLSLLTREIHHHRRLRHPHILALYEIIATESSIYLITELCTGGELFDYLVEKGRLSLLESRRIFGQLVLGLNHLHNLGVVHRDLKLENILLDEECNVKIADLGFGREFEKGRWMETWVGTLGYCAPEVVSGKRYLGEEVDIWSLGVILYTLLSGSLPFDDDDESIMKEKILKCEFDIPVWLDEDAADLIKSILQLDPLRRPSLKSILSHRFFTKPPIPTSYSYSPNPNESTRNSPYIPPVILEEPASPVQSLSKLSEEEELPTGVVLVVGGHSITASDISDDSFMTAVTSDSDAGGSGEIPTPITSASEDDVDLEEDSESEIKAGKRKALDQSSSAGQTVVDRDDETYDSLGFLHRNTSQTTIRRGNSTDLSTGTPNTRRGIRTSSLPTSTAEEDDSATTSSSITYPTNTSPSISKTSPIPTAYQTYLGLAAPRLTRNFSHDSTASLFSLGGSPIPPHNRTPSRTKRKSVGSMYSERLITLEENDQFDSLNINYLDLMGQERPDLLSTVEEKLLLKKMGELGFDEGQISHSILTDACDSSAAIWWMLRRKAENSSNSTKEGEADIPVVEKIVSTRSNSYGPNNSKGSSSSSRRPSIPKKKFFDLHHDTESSSHLSSDDDEVPHFPIRPPITTSPAPISYTSSSIPNTTSTAKTSSGYDLLSLAPTIDSNPTLPPSILSTPPLIPFDPPTNERLLTPTKLSTMTKDSGSNNSPENSPVSPSISLPGTPGGTESGKKRARSASVSMLARATSAIGLKKSNDASTTTANNEKLALTTEGLVMNNSTAIHSASLSPGGGTTPKASLVPLPSLGTPPPSSPAKRLSTIPLLSYPTPPKAPLLPSSASQQTFDTVNGSSPSVKTGGGGGTKKSIKGGNLFSNFKMWFGDDKKKRRKMAASHNEEVSHQSRNVQVSRRSTSGHRQDSLGVSSPVRRPQIGSRRSSAASLAPPSRRSSMNSNHQPTNNTTTNNTITNSNSNSTSRIIDQSTSLSPNLGFTGGHHRRRSDSSRASNSDREHSRPPSLRSFSGGVDHLRGSRMQQGSKAGSASSVGSHGATSNQQPHFLKDVYRRPSATTTVRRIHHHGSSGGHHHSNRHSRNRSTSSSVTRRSSSSSYEDELDDRFGGISGLGGSGTGGGQEETKAAPILEEDESESASEDRTVEERERTLRKLSGEFTTTTTLSTGTTPSTSRLRQSSSTSSPRPSIHSHHSSSSSKHHHSNTPIIFSAHKTRHVFGTPSQPSSSSSTSTSISNSNLISKKSSQPSNNRPALRDIFAKKQQKDVDGEWIDEIDDLGGYGGGLGQHSTIRNSSIGSTTSTSTSSIIKSNASSFPTSSSSTTNNSNSPPSSTTPARSESPSTSMFENRYAGVVPLASSISNSEGSGTITGSGNVGSNSGSWRNTQGRPPAFRSAVVIEEEEEEEEE